MFDEVFDPLYEPLPDAEQYLKRLGITSFQKPDKETLDALILAHLRTVPFENIDIYDASADVSIGIPDLFDKIVIRRRGGYCFELNAVFAALLTSLGYDCYSVAVRIVWHYERPMPVTHRAMIVTIDGIRYFCDVGFGGPLPQCALLIDESGGQPSAGNVFFFEKDAAYGTMLCRLFEGEKEPILSFFEEPTEQVDFLAPHEWQSQNSYSMFKNGRLCNRVTESGVVTLGGNVLRVHSDGNVVETTLETEEELRGALKEHFGIEGNFPLNI